MLHKTNKVDYTVVKSHRVISLYNCLEKVCKKVAAEMLADWCEVHHILHEGQMRLRRQQSIIDTVVQVMLWVQEARAEGRLAGMLLMDVKGSFNYVSRKSLIRKIQALSVDGDLV